jgi:hypothetical protein
MTTALKVACGSCGRLFGKDEHAWADDWTVADAPDWKWRMETRYTCDDCHEKAAS